MADKREIRDVACPGELASKENLLHFFVRLEKALDDSGFFRVNEKRPTMVRNIRNIFQRSSLTDQEIRTLQGIITSLSKGNN